MPCFITPPLLLYPHSPLCFLGAILVVGNVHVDMAAVRKGDDVTVSNTLSVSVVVAAVNDFLDFVRDSSSIGIAVYRGMITGTT